MIALKITVVVVAVVFVLLAITIGALLLAANAWDAWEKIPQEVRREQRQWSGALRPANLLICALACLSFSNVAPDTMGMSSSSVLSIVAGVVLLGGASLHFVWAIRILRRRASVPPSLSRFARYAMALSVIGFAMAAGLLAKCVAGV